MSSDLISWTEAVRPRVCPPERLQCEGLSPGKNFLYLYLYNAFTISWHGTHNRARLQIKCALGGGTGISLLLSISVWVLLSSLIEWRETRPTAVSLMFLSTNGVAKEGRPNFNPRPGRGLNRDLLVGSQRSY